MKMFVFAPSCKLMMTVWPSGENRGEKLMPGKLPTIFALPGIDVVEIDARIALAVSHVGDFLGRGRKPRREHEFVAAREITHVGAVLIHDGEPLDASLAGPVSSTNTTRLSK